MDKTYQKLENLKNYLCSLESAAIAFSGGVDSAFLLKVAADVLGFNGNIIAITAHMDFFPEKEHNKAVEFAKALGVRHVICDIEESEIEGVSQNPPNRCYLCKKEIFNQFIKTAKQYNLKNVAEGSNMDDNSEYRPGHIAISELSIKSPLRHAELTKDEIRFLSKEMGLPTWNKRSFACLASRFVYGETITKQKLKMVGAAEQFLLDMGFGQLRVRLHSDLARIEVSTDDFEKISKPEMRELVYAKLKEYGFNYVCIDLYGYRTGSMNETLRL